MVNVCNVGIHASYYMYSKEIVMYVYRINVDSEEFSEHLQPFLLTRTPHFLHELISFARSPLNMAAYDSSVRYEWPTGRPRDDWDPEATVNSLPQQLQDSPSSVQGNNIVV